MGMFRQLSRDEAPVLGEGFHGIENTSEQRLVPAHESQIIVVRHVRLGANPRNLFPEQSGEMFVCPLRRVQREAIVHFDWNDSRPATERERKPK